MEILLDTKKVFICQNCIFCEDADLGDPFIAWCRRTSNRGIATKTKSFCGDGKWDVSEFWEQPDGKAETCTETWGYRTKMTRQGRIRMYVKQTVGGPALVRIPESSPMKEPNQ